jgi:hypothetical protein
LTNSAPDIYIVYIVNNDHTNIEGGVMRVGSTGRSVGGRRDLFGAANPASRTASMRLCAESLWLAREEMRWAWSAYMWSVLIVLSLGLAAAVSLSLGVSEFEAMVLRGHGTEEFYGAFFVDYLFLLVCAVIGTNALLGYYTRNWLGTSSSRLVLLGKLPLSAGILVGSRMVSMLLALVVGAFAFFVPVFFVSGLAEDLGVKAYLVFCAVWVGYGLLGSGLSLFFEFGVSGRSYVLLSYLFALFLMILVVLLETTEYAGLVGRVARMAQGGRGTLLAGLSILAGFAALLLLSGATVRRLRTRDLYKDLSA